MLAELLAEVQASGLASTLRQSHWVYPIVNTGHIVGIALLFGAIVPLDLRLIGFWPRIPVGLMARTLLPIALTGMLLAFLTGSLLFSVQATKYAGITLFRIKLLLFLAAVANALLLRGTMAWLVHQGPELSGTSPRLQLAGALSIGFWLATIFAGRMIGYL